MSNNNGQEKKNNNNGVPPKNTGRKWKQTIAQPVLILGLLVFGFGFMQDTLLKKALVISGGSAMIIWSHTVGEDQNDRSGKEQ